MAVFAFFRPIFAIRNDHQHHMGEYGSILACTFFGFLHFLPFLGIFCIFWVPGGVGGVLGVLLRYKINSRIKFVVGRVNG